MWREKKAKRIQGSRGQGFCQRTGRLRIKGSSGGQRIDLGTAKVIAADIKRRIGVTHLCSVCSVVGSIRRERPEVHDIDLVVVPLTEQSWLDIRNWAARTAVAGSRISSGVRLISFTGAFRVGDTSPTAATSGHVPDRIVQVDINRADSENLGMLELAKTGSAQHNIWLATQAKRLGMKFCPTRGIERGGQIIAGRTEQEVFEALGLQYVEPAQREVRWGKPVWQG